MTAPYRRRLCRWCRHLSLGGDAFGGHDYCIQNLPGVRFACCGHGTDSDRAYVAFDDGLTLYGNAALAAMEMIGGHPPERRFPHLRSIAIVPGPSTS